MLTKPLPKYLPKKRKWEMIRCTKENNGIRHMSLQIRIRGDLQGLRIKCRLEKLGVGWGRNIVKLVKRKRKCLFRIWNRNWRSNTKKPMKTHQKTFETNLFSTQDQNPFYLLKVKSCKDLSIGCKSKNWVSKRCWTCWSIIFRIRKILCRTLGSRGS